MSQKLVTTGVAVIRTPHGTEQGRRGCYVLRIVVSEPLHMSFGRYRGGAPIAVPPGSLAYVGSALGERGSPLASRLLRHATRTGDRPPHAIRAQLRSRLLQVPDVGPLVPLKDKRLHWHVDYLLDRPETEIVGMIVLPTNRRVEQDLADRLAAADGAAPLAAGLGAGDHRGATHLLIVPNAEGWWSAVADAVAGLVGA